MPRTHKDTDKQKALRHQGTLNPRPQDVRHPLFRDSDFFDPDDMIQVKYEMLRQVHVDNLSISQLQSLALLVDFVPVYRVSGPLEDFRQLVIARQAPSLTKAATLQNGRQFAILTNSYSEPILD